MFQFDSVSSFFAMGGYGFYIWLAYGVTFFAMGLLIWQSRRETRQILKLVRSEVARENIAKQQR